MRTYNERNIEIFSGLIDGVPIEHIAQRYCISCSRINQVVSYFISVININDSEFITLPITKKNLVNYSKDRLLGVLEAYFVRGEGKGENAWLAPLSECSASAILSKGVNSKEELRKLILEGGFDPRDEYCIGIMAYERILQYLGIEYELAPYYAELKGYHYK